MRQGVGDKIESISYFIQREANKFRQAIKHRGVTVSQIQYKRNNTNTFSENVNLLGWGGGRGEGNKTHSKGEISIIIFRGTQVKNSLESE